MRRSSPLPWLLLVLACCGPGASTAPDGLARTQVEANVSSLVLGDECFPAVQRACALGQQCDPLCRESSVAVQLTSRGSRAVKLEFTAVRLFDGPALMTTLKPSWAARRTGANSRGWDGTLARAEALEVLVSLSAPPWSTMNTDVGELRSTFAVSYRTEIDLRVDGVAATLAGPTVRREPMVTP